MIDGRPTVLFCAWLAWCRFRIVIPLRDRTIPSVFAALDTSFRMLGGAPTYLLTDNEKSVTVEHVAGLPVRNVQAVAFGRHYPLTELVRVDDALFSRSLLDLGAWQVTRSMAP